MRGCAWLTGIDRHALHVPCTSRLGSLAKPYLRWSLQGPGAFTIVIFGIGFVLSHLHMCVITAKSTRTERAHQSCLNVNKGKYYIKSRGTNRASAQRK
jgi:hypothetical protein